MFFYLFNLTYNDMAKKTMTLKEAFEIMLLTAKTRLATAISRGNEWEKNHYEYDIYIIKKNMEGL